MSIFTIIFVIFSCSSEQQPDQVNSRIDQESNAIEYSLKLGSDDPALGYADEAIIEEGYVLNKKKNGLWREYDQNQRLISEKKFHEDVLHGVSIFFDYKGNKIIQTRYDFGEIVTSDTIDFRITG